MAYKKQTKDLTFNLSGVENEKDTKNQIGEFIVNEMLSKLSEGKSPVDGEIFPELNKKYAKDEKGNDRTPNLELDGDMLDKLGFNLTATGIEIGILDESQWGKADGHNKFGKANNNKIPKRRFIPTKSGKFSKDIRNGIKQIIKDNKVEIRQPDQDISIIPLEQSIFDIKIEDVLGKNFFDDFGL